MGKVIVTAKKARLGTLVLTCLITVAILATEIYKTNTSKIKFICYVQERDESHTQMKLDCLHGAAETPSIRFSPLVLFNTTDTIT